MKHAACLIFLGCPSIWAKYNPPSIEYLAGNADVIALGEIVELNRKTFVLRVDRLIIGDSQITHLKINRFKDWTCAHRWKPYRKGQREIVFVKRSDQTINGEPIYKLMSAGDEAEWEVRGTLVYSLGFRMPDTEKVGESEHPGQILDLENLIHALTHYRSYFKFITSDDNEPWKYEIQVIGTAEAIKAYSDQSPLHAYMVAQSHPRT